MASGSFFDLCLKVVQLSQFEVPVYLAICYPSKSMQFKLTFLYNLSIVIVSWFSVSVFRRLQNRCVQFSGNHWQTAMGLCSASFMNLTRTLCGWRKFVTASKRSVARRYCLQWCESVLLLHCVGAGIGRSTTPQYIIQIFQNFLILFHGGKYSIRAVYIWYTKCVIILWALFK